MKTFNDVAFHFDVFCNTHFLFKNGPRYIVYFHKVLTIICQVRSTHKRRIKTETIDIPLGKNLVSIDFFPTTTCFPVLPGLPIVSGVA
eukprot:UN03041